MISTVILLKSHTDIRCMVGNNIPRKPELEAERCRHLSGKFTLRYLTSNTAMVTQFKKKVAVHWAAMNTLIKPIPIKTPI